MNVRACVTTAKAPAAIAAIRLEGPDAATVLAAIAGARRAAPGATRTLQPGDLIVTDITDGSETLDQVVIACPEPGTFDINCHGNPLIVAAIMRLLNKHGAKLTSAEQVLRDRLRPRCEDAIELEARMAQFTAATLPGVQLIAAQARTGLAAAAKHWLASVETEPLDSIRRQAAEALRLGRLAKPLIHGCTIVLAGPPNSGKSTLLNALAGRPQAITADIPGTTRDYVTACCRIGPLSVEFVDTAGLWEGYHAHEQPRPRAGVSSRDSTLHLDPIDRDAQTAAKEILSNCDLVLHVIDATQPGPIEPIPAQSPVIVVFNKSDLPHRITSKDLAFQPAATATVSALHAKGLEDLAQAIQTALGLADIHAAFGVGSASDVAPEAEGRLPVPFTTRQTTLLNRLTTATDESECKSLIKQLLTAPLTL